MSENASTCQGRIQALLKGRSIEAVARDAGIARATLYGIVKGDRKRGAYPDTIERLARVLGVEASYLHYGSPAVAA